MAIRARWRRAMVPLAFLGTALLAVVADETAGLGEQTEQLLRGATLDVVLLHGPFGSSTRKPAAMPS